MEFEAVALPLLRKPVSQGATCALRVAVTVLADTSARKLFGREAAWSAISVVPASSALALPVDGERGLWAVSPGAGLAAFSFRGRQQLL